MRKLHPQYLLFTSCLSAAVVPHFALANPEGGNVVAGSAVITSSGNTVDIHQSTNRAIIDWRSFDIAPNETTRFHQPDASSHTLNRVNSMSRSVIEGTIQANGNITIVNPNGVFFKQGSTVDVGGLTATSADTTNANFMAGKAQHDIASANTAAEVRNDGTITIKDSGLAALVAPRVANDGVITAKLGKVHLASGDSFVMDVGGDGHMQVAMSQQTLQRQLVSNSGKISADGGYVALTAAAARDAVDSLITNTGVIEAKSVGAIQGKVLLQGAGAGSTIVHAGTIDVSGKRAGEKGGKVEILADQIALAGTSKIDASGHTGATGTTNGTAVSAVRNGAAGGDIKIGGDYQGQGTTPTATKLFVAHGAVIKNDAISSGDAGRTILWSDDTTQFNGTISATSINGKGGFTEVSGKNTLGFNGVVDLRSTLGSQGTLLLDPTDITISTAANTGTMLWDGTSFSDTVAATSNLNTTTLQNQLALSDVIVTTASGLGGAGDITVSNTITWNSGFSLDLQADNHININANITNSGAGAIILTAGLDGAGNIYINGGSDISTLGALTLSATGGTIEVAATGTVDLTGTGLTANSTINMANTGALALNLRSRTGNLAVNAINMSGNASSQSLSFFGDSMDINGAVNVSGGNKYVYINPFTASRQVSVGGAVGGLELSDAEMDRISGYTGSNNRFHIGYASGGAIMSGNIVYDAYNWIQQGLYLNTTGDHIIQGAQNYGYTAVSFIGGIEIGAAMTNFYGLSFSGKAGQVLTVGGAGAGANVINATELDFMSSGAYNLIGISAGSATGLELYEYTNWRTNSLTIGKSGATTQILGNQATTASTTFCLGGCGGGDSTSYNFNVDANITGAGITFDSATGGTVNLGGNLTSTTGNVTLARNVTLTGAAGTTRTITTGTGAFVLNDNGTTTNGNIIATDKNLEIISNTLTVTGTMTGTTGEVRVSPYTTTHTIGVGTGGAHNVSYSDAFVNMLKAGFANYVFGRSTTGNITNYMSTWDDNVTFLSSGNFTSGAAITADDSVTINVGNDITIAHNITATNGPITLTAGGDGAGNIAINSGANIDAGLGALTITATGGQIDVGNHNGTVQTLAGTGVTINSALVHAPQGSGQTINARTGTLTLGSTLTWDDSIAQGLHFLNLIGDDFAINNTVTFNSGAQPSSLNVATYTAGRQLSLAGEVGGAELSTAELDRLTFSTGMLSFGVYETAWNTQTRNGGDIVVGARTWNNGNNSTGVSNRFYTTGANQTIINGAQAFSSRGLTIYGDVDINAGITGIGSIVNLYGKAGETFTIGGAAGTTILDSTELDFFGQTAWLVMNASEATAMDVAAYSGWKASQIVFTGGSTGKTITFSGAQGMNAGATSTFRIGYGSSTDTFNVNANIDTSAAAPFWGDIQVEASATHALNLGANLISGGGVNIGRAVNLTGAAGTTRTINGGVGTLTITNNGTTALGSIASGDKNLAVIADALALDPVNLTATTGGILLSPYTTGWTIGVGDGGAHNVSYSTAFVNTLKTNFAHYTFGRNTTGNITNYMTTWDDPVTFLSSGNFATGAAITSADDGMTVSVGNNIVMNHSTGATNGAIVLTAGGDGAGNIDINDGAHFNLWTGSFTATATGGQITIADADITAAGGITLNSNVVFDGSGVGNQMNAYAGITWGTFTNNGTITSSVYPAWAGLIIRANDYNINQDIDVGAGRLSLYAPSIGVAGAAGTAQLASAELDRLTTARLSLDSNITANAHTWSGSIGEVVFSHVGTALSILGDQNFNQHASISSYNGTIHIGANMTNIGAAGNVFGILADGTGATTLGMGGAAGSINLDDTELDYIADGWGSIRVQTYVGAEVGTYSNWRDPLNFLDSGGGSIVISGNQSSAAASNATFTVGSGESVINANVDFSASNGSISLAGFGATHTLGGNLIGNGITIMGATTLTGAAGATHTIDAGTGTFDLMNNGAWALGSIAAGDKNLTVIADSVALTGAITSTSGNLHLRPLTDSTTIRIGGVPIGFSLSTAELALIDAGSGILTLGSATGSGNFLISTNHVFDEHVVFQTGTGIITVGANLSSNAKNMTFSTDVGNFRVSGNRSISTVGGGNLTFASIDGALGSEIVTVNSGGTLTITGASGSVNAFDELNLTSQGAMAMDDVTSGLLFARTLGATSDITLNGVLTMLNNGTALELASGDDIINNHGAGVFALNGGARFLTWSDDPLQDTGEEHFSGAATKRYNRNYGDAVDPTGNFRNYSVAPTLTVRGNNTQYTYGDAVNAPTTYAITGWHMAEDEAAHSMGGAATFQTSYAQGNNAGTSYAVTNNGSTLSSDMGYQIGYAASPSLTVNKANLRVKAVNLNYTAGSGVPVVTFLYAPADFKLGQNAGTAGITGSATVSNINWNTIAAGTYAMQVGLGGLSSINYSFSELMPRGTLTVTGAAPVITPPAHNNLPSTVQQVMNNAGILYTGTSLYGASGTNNGANTNSATRKARDTNAGTSAQNVSLYDSMNGSEVALMLSSVHIDPVVMRAFGLTYGTTPPADSTLQ